MQSRYTSSSQARIISFIEDNFQSLQEKHKKRQETSSNKKRRKQTQIIPYKVLVIVGNTQMIREYVLNELKDDHNLIIQRVSMAQRRNAQYFKNSINEGTQSSVQTAGQTNTIFNSFFQLKPKPTPQTEVVTRVSD